jgi:hypothetical protein
VFVDPDCEACELIGDPEASVASMRPNRSFSEVVKVANFSSNEGEGEGEGEGSGWVCASAWLISVMACSNSEASFSVRCVFASSSNCMPFSICLIGFVCASFRFLPRQVISSVFMLFVDWLRVTLLVLVRGRSAVSSSDRVWNGGISTLVRDMASEFQ